jgi:hypothetical protein
MDKVVELVVTTMAVVAVDCSEMVVGKPIQVVE